MQRRRNEGGRFSSTTGSDWYKAIEADNIARIEREGELQQVIEAWYAQAAEEAEADELAEQYEQAA